MMKPNEYDCCKAKKAIKTMGFGSTTINTEEPIQIINDHDSSWISPRKSKETAYSRAQRENVDTKSSRDSNTLKSVKGRNFDLTKTSHARNNSSSRGPGKTPAQSKNPTFATKQPKVIDTTKESSTLQRKDVHCEAISQVISCICKEKFTQTEKSYSWLVASIDFMQRKSTIACVWIFVLLTVAAFLIKVMYDRYEIVYKQSPTYYRFWQ